MVFAPQAAVGGLEKSTREISGVAVAFGAAVVPQCVQIETSRRGLAGQGQQYDQ